MKARYIRVSSIKQNEERQLVKQHSGEKIYIDKISGAIPFENRPSAKELLADISKGLVNYISVSSIDRLGRSTLDVLQTIDELHKKNVTVKVDNLGLESIANGKENPTFKLIISVLANISEMERASIRERQLEGILLAKAKGIYKGREKGTVDTKEVILSRYSKVVAYLKKPNRPTLEEIAKLSGCSKNTVQKVKMNMLALTA